MSEKWLRIEAEKRGRAVTDEGWDLLKLDGCVQDALGQDFDEEKVAEIVKGIDRVRASMGMPVKSVGHPPRGAEEGPHYENGARPGPFEVDLTDAEQERARLFLEAQITAAAEDSRVRGFADRYRPDGPLAPEGAERFLQAGLRELESLSSYLSRYYGWHKGEAAWWVLTGETPSARPVRVSFRTAETLDPPKAVTPNVYLITIEAPPWVSPATLEGAFAEMRRRLGVERKPPTARSLRVARFVKGLRPDPTAKEPTFREMCRRWNEQYPAEAFSEARSFERAAVRTLEVLSRRYNTDIERAETPELQRQHARAQKFDEQIRETARKYPAS